jgi:hypothetical protein
MRKIKMDASVLSQKYGEANSLKELFLAVEKEFYQTDEVVCRFIIDGHEVDESAEARLAEANRGQIKILEVHVQTVEKVIASVIGNWIERMPQLIFSTENLSKHIRFNGAEGSLSYFVELIDNCQLLVESLMSISSVLQDRLNVIDQNWQVSEKLMAQAIGEALIAFEKKDFNQLSDVLEYDLANCLQTWQELLKNLIVKLENTHGDLQSPQERDL